VPVRRAWALIDEEIMPKSLLEALPEIVAKGKRQAEQILEGIDGRNRVTLQTRELVIPSREAAQRAIFGGSSLASPPSPQKVRVTSRIA
jgi:adenine-specific DNA-methyltransferase